MKRKQGEKHGIQHRQGRERGCTRSTSRAPWSAGGRAQFATDDERLAYKVQDAFLKKQVVKQGPLVGYKIALTSPQILAQTGLQRPRLRPDPQEARVRAQGRPSAPIAGRDWAPNSRSS